MRAEQPDLALRALFGIMEKSIEKTLTDTHGRRRVDLFRRPSGTFGFEELRWLDEEHAWIPAGRYSESFSSSLKDAESEARERVEWLRATDAVDF